MSEEAQKQNYSDSSLNKTLVAALAFLSVGRFDPSFIPLDFGGLTANQIGFYVITISLSCLSLRFIKVWPFTTYFGISVLALSIWALVSPAWSVSPLASFAKAISYSFTMMAAIYVARKMSINEIVTGALYGLFAVVAISAILAILLPNTAGSTMFHPGAWRGLFMQKNVLGRTALLLSVFAYIVLYSPDLRNVKKFAKFCILISFVVLLETKSVTAIAVFFVFSCSLPLFIYLRSRGPVYRSLLVLSVMVLAPAMILVTEPFILWFAELTGKSVTLSGRVPLWEFSIRKLQAAPFTGFGIEGFFGTNFDYEFFAEQRWIAEHAHNGFLDLTLELGLVGLAIILVALGRFAQSVPSPNGHMRTLSVAMMSILSIIVFLNITESNLFRSSNLIWVFFLIFGFHGRKYVSGSGGHSQVFPRNIG